ncbi:DUF6973 domain-containing protein [Denitromonas ohlonensis]|uniref:DUF6973 domain-containing protein n=2 Tax=Denitromonas TaxID=139331 RepID=A0A557RC74_9RHOO|nr:hypothetical protein [Denitromonas ohlonensis]TVO62698.1 hypothetical protein FHP90_16920 [Denitromonas ohlonensis]TVO78903.1 hypothetical protein FHP89_04405 [Denitromonas ohlonensis]
MSSSILAQYEQLTPQERNYITSHPHHALTIRQSKETAFEATKARFGFNGRNDKSDAFRHCFWSAILARDIGYANALRFTTAHESSLINPKNEKAMDLHNNSVGLVIGRQGGSDQILSHRCMEALVSRRLTVLIP